jgi:hypothetical protein
MTADAPALLQLGITRPDALIDREDGRSAKGRLQLRAVREGHLAPRPGVKNQFVVTEVGRAVLAAKTREAVVTTETQPTPDERAGIAWWNALDEAARRYWLQQAGNTGRAADAWAAYKRAERPDDGNR